MKNKQSIQNMHKICKRTYIVYYSFGEFKTKIDLVPISAQELPEYIDKGIFAFQFLETNSPLIALSYQNTLPKNLGKLSERHYIGEVYNEKKIIEELDDPEYLLINMSMNNWKKVVKLENGNYIPLLRGEKVYTPKQLALSVG
jgi:tyrosine-protein phosphatase YwqE